MLDHRRRRRARPPHQELARDGQRCPGRAGAPPLLHFKRRRAFAACSRREGRLGGWPGRVPWLCWGGKLSDGWPRIGGNRQQLAAVAGVFAAMREMSNPYQAALGRAGGGESFASGVSDRCAIQVEHDRQAGFSRVKFQLQRGPDRSADAHAVPWDTPAQGEVVLTGTCWLSHSSRERRPTVTAIAHLIHVFPTCLDPASESW